MTLARVTTWVDGNTLTAAALNGEFDNIIANPASLISPLNGSVDFALYPVANWVMEQPATVPTTVTVGRYYHSGLVGQPFVGTATQGYQPISRGISSVTGLQGSLISNIGSFQANTYQFQSSFLAATVVTATSSFSVNTQLAGYALNGRDQAAAFTSTTVHFYAVINRNGSTALQGVVSSNPPSVGPNGTVASGYYWWCYLGSAIYTPASSVMTKSALINGSVVTLSTYEKVLTDGGSTAVSTGIPLGGIVPQVAPLVHMTMVNAGGIPTGSGGLDAEHKVYVSSSGATGSNSFEAFTLYSGSSMTWRGTTMGFRIPNINTPPNVSYRNAINTGTSATLSLLVNGYSVPNGDVG